MKNIVVILSNRYYIIYYYIDYYYVIYSFKSAELILMQLEVKLDPWSVSNSWASPPPRTFALNSLQSDGPRTLLSSNRNSLQLKVLLSGAYLSWCLSKAVALNF